MSKTIDKISDLKYNELSTLYVIEHNTDLKEIFTDKVKVSFHLLKTLSKEDKLSPETKNFIKDLFDKVILTKANLINEYSKYLSQTTFKTNKLPRRYGATKIISDVNKSGEKPTVVQLAAISVNTLKNIYTNLNRRLIKKMLASNDNLTETDCRDIISAVTTIERQMKNILKKK